MPFPLSFFLRPYEGASLHGVARAMLCPTASSAPEYAHRVFHDVFCRFLDSVAAQITPPRSWIAICHSNSTFSWCNDVVLTRTHQPSGDPG